MNMQREVYILQLETALRNLCAVAPENWNDDDDPDQQEAWRTAFDLVGERS